MKTRQISVVISYGESTQIIDMVVVPDNLDDDEEEGDDDDDDDDDDDEIHRSLAAVSSAFDPSRCNDIHTRSNTQPFLTVQRVDGCNGRKRRRGGRRRRETVGCGG